MPKTNKKNWWTTLSGIVLGASMAASSLGVHIGSIKTDNGPIGYEKLIGAIAAVTLGVKAQDTKKEQQF